MARLDHCSVMPEAPPLWNAKPTSSQVMSDNRLLSKEDQGVFEAREVVAKLRATEDELKKDNSMISLLLEEYTRRYWGTDGYCKGYHETFIFWNGMLSDIK
ncbi:hypothetical protein VNO78_08880 [Psophocarpus tetragonolobus]|uniref:Uncharacterized protein n=1 Tax=Psophocarpus tetragonolobus TaxID=3891 RepID=A0AAN9SYP3_PSOTE